MSKDIKIYEYKRGDKYSCKVSIINNDTILFSDIKYPANTTDEIIERLLNDAEKAAFKQHGDKKMYG